MKVYQGNSLSLQTRTFKKCGKEDVMKMRFMFIFIAIILIIPFVFISLAHAKPPKPGPNFVWVPTYTTPGCVIVPGHWKYEGPFNEGKEWVPGHYNANGVWVPGHWKKTPRGHKWVKGHWR